jgi:hypothetical protein
MSKAGELLREVRSKAGFAASRPAFLTQYKELNWGQDPEVLRNWEDGRVLFKEEQVLDLLRVGLVKHGTDEHRALLEAIMFDERERLRLNSLRVLANNQEASEEPEAYFAPPKSEAAVTQDNGQTQTVVSPSDEATKKQLEVLKAIGMTLTDVSAQMESLHAIEARLVAVEQDFKRSRPWMYLCLILVTLAVLMGLAVVYRLSDVFLDRLDVIIQLLS